MDKVRVSIIIPVYNAERYLDICLKSILSQDMTSYEVILVDDGSTDSSPLICDRYSATDSRFRTIHKPNGGVSSARNAGMNLAKGEYLMFVDSDDALLPDVLEKMLDNAAGEDVIIGGYAAFIEEVPRKEVVPSRSYSYKAAEMDLFFKENVRRNCEMLDAPWAKLLRRKAVGSLRFCEELSYAEDKLFVFSLLSVCSSVRTCSAPVYAYNLRPGTLGSDVASDRHLMQLRRFIPEYIKVLEALNRRFPSNEKLSSLYRKDVIGRYICRILNIFARRRTSLMTKEYLEWVYGIMDGDPSLGLLSIRFGQVFNMMLYKIRKPALSLKVYRFTSGLISIFNA